MFLFYGWTYVQNILCLTVSKWANFDRSKFSYLATWLKRIKQDIKLLLFLVLFSKSSGPSQVWYIVAWRLTILCFDRLVPSAVAVHFAVNGGKQGALGVMVTGPGPVPRALRAPCSNQGGTPGDEMCFDLNCCVSRQILKSRETLLLIFLMHSIQ